MLPAATRFKLHDGPYKTPRLKRASIVEDEIRGEVTIVGLTDAANSWPIGKNGRAKTYIVFGALTRAIRRESVQAVATGSESPGPGCRHVVALWACRCTTRGLCDYESSTRTSRRFSGLDGKDSSKPAGRKRGPRTRPPGAEKGDNRSLDERSRQLFVGDRRVPSIAGR